MVHTYFHELAYFAPKPRKQLITFEDGSKKTTPKEQPPKNPTLPRVLLSYSKGYFDLSSVHGFRYLTKTKLYHFERVIWLLLLLATTCTCLYVYTELADLYRSKRIHTVVEDSVEPIYTKPFPAIGICPNNRVDWPKVLKADQKFLPKASAEAVQAFRQFFAIMSDIHFGSFDRLQPLIELEVDLSQLDKVDITEVMQDVGVTCVDFFEHPCMWRRTAYNCCDIFSFERTEYGFCFVFNSLITEASRERKLKDRYYPYHISQISEKSGLEVILKVDKRRMYPQYTGITGIYILVKQQEQWHSDSHYIPPNTYVKLPILPQFTVTDERTRSVSPEERKCLFQDEVKHPLYKKPPGLFYRRSNCVTRCRQEYVFKYCKCDLDLFFPHDSSDNMPKCKGKDFNCLYENRELFNSDHEVAAAQYVENASDASMLCNCLNSCNQLLYVPNYISEPWNANSSDLVQKIHLDVHYPSRYMIRYRTGVRYTFVELLANFGGVIGLFMGASLVSGVELIYYFTIGLYIHLQEHGYISDGRLTSRKSTVEVANLGDEKILKQPKKILQNNKNSPTTHIHHLRH